MNSYVSARRAWLVYLDEWKAGPPAGLSSKLA